MSFLRGNGIVRARVGHTRLLSRPNVFLEKVFSVRFRGFATEFSHSVQPGERRRDRAAMVIDEYLCSGCELLLARSGVDAKDDLLTGFNSPHDVLIVGAFQQRAQPVPFVTWFSRCGGAVSR